MIHSDSDTFWAATAPRRRAVQEVQTSDLFPELEASGFRPTETRR